MATNIYLQLTEELNRGRVRAVLSSGQAVVRHRLAIMSKDGDWILREDEETLAHTLAVLEAHGARYRFGAPLDLRWLRHGWSSHLEFRTDELRVRTDFVTRPPRLSPAQLRALWREQAGRSIPVVDVEPLALLKRTNREKDYAVIGELARLLDEPRAQLLHSRSALDLISVAAAHPRLVSQLALRRPVLRRIRAGRARLEAALDAERRTLMRANEERLRGYQRAAERWAAVWPEVAAAVQEQPLRRAHVMVVARAEGVLPFRPSR